MRASHAQQAVKKTRCFLAMLPGPELHRQLFDCARQLRARTPEREVRWSRAEQMHLTLAFFGDLSDEQINKLCEAMPVRLKGIAPVSSFIDQVSQFPNPANPKVIAALADLSPTLHAVQQQCFLPGEYPDTRFRPHITLGRYRRSPHIPVFNPLPVAWQFHADEVLLVASELTQEGPVYTELAGFRLKG